MADVQCGSLNETVDLVPADPPITTDCALFDFTVYTVIGGSLCVLGLVGNALSFVVLRMKDNAKSATTFLLRALAVADSLVLLVTVPLYALTPIHPVTGHLAGYYNLYFVIMRYLWPLYLMPYTGTILLTVLVSLNRYLAVCKPFKAVTSSSGGSSASGFDSVRRQVACVALFAVVYNIPRFFEYHSVTTCVGYNVSDVRFELSTLGNNKIYRILYANVLYFVVMHGGPILSLSFLNVKLILALKAQERRRREMQCAVRQNQMLQQDLTLVLVVVVFVFIFCQTPTFVDHILWTVVDKEAKTCGRWHFYYTAVGDLLAILNSSVNFAVYVLTSRKFRRGLGTVCSTWMCCCCAKIFGWGSSHDRVSDTGFRDAGITSISPHEHRVTDNNHHHRVALISETAIFSDIQHEQLVSP